MKFNLRNRQTVVILIAAVCLLLAYLVDQRNAPLGETLREVAQIVLTTDGHIEPTMVGVLLPTPSILPRPSPTTAPITPTARATLALAPFYQIYFTRPTCPAEAERIGGLDVIVAADLRQATEQVDVAAFELDMPTLVDALIELAKRGVTVRIVTDSDNAKQSSINRLRRNGISVVEDKRSGLMHNKFIIIDQHYLWTGSMNLASSDIYCHNNNFVRFDAPTLAANYTAEMDEMYGERSFGPTSPQNTPNEHLLLNGIEVENYFAPEKEMELVNVLARTVVRAEHEILFMAFSFTSEAIGEAMLGRADAGVQVRGIFEKLGAESGYYPIMAAASLPNVDVRLDGNSALLHHKVIIIDRKTVIFGSFNFSASANRNNDENLVVVYDPTFAGYFVQEFEQRWAEAPVDRLSLANPATPSSNNP